MLSQAVDEFNKLNKSAITFDKSLSSIVTKTDKLGKMTTTSTFIGQTDKQLQKLKITTDETGKVLTQSFTQTAKTGKQLKSGLSSIFDANKLYLYWNLTKRLRTSLASVYNLAVDYIETQNKFNVSMGYGKPQAIKFVNQMSEAVGIAKAELMDYQTTYKNILSGLGNFTDIQSERVSESLVKMAMDYSSMFNVGQEDAMNKFQSALVGSIRPIRTDSGYDVSDTTIGAKAQSLGIDRSVNQLNQMEKRMLRIIVLMEQLGRTGAMGDLARTIEQPSNQMKVLQAQIKETGIWIGNVFMGTVGKVLPYINAFVMVIKELIKMLAIFSGYVGDDTNLSDVFEAVEGSTSGVSNNLGTASKKAKELKKTLTGFDVLNVINTPTESSGSSSSGGVGTIDPKILSALSDYESKMEQVSMKATEIRDRIMEWLGYTKEIDPVTGEISWKLKEGYTNIEKIGDALKVIAGVTIIKKISSLFSIIANSKIAFAIQAVAGGAATLGEGFAYAFPSISKVVGILTGGSGLVTALGTIGTSLGTIFGITLTGISAVLVGATAVVAAIVGLVYGGIKLYQWAVEDAVGSTDKLSGVSEETVQQLEPVQGAFDNLVQTINSISYDNMALTPEEEKNIEDSIDNLTKKLKETLQSYIDEQIKNLNYLYKETGMITEEEYNQRLEQLQNYHKEESEKIETKGKELKESYKTLFDENGNIIMSAYADWLEELENYENESLAKLTLSEDDKNKIIKNANEKSKAEQIKYFSELLQGYAKDRDNSKEISKQKYDNTLESAKKLYGETSTEYQRIADKAKEIYDQEVKDADEKYNQIYEDFTESTGDMADYIDKDDGHLLSNWEKTWNTVKNTVSSAISSVKTWWNNLSFNSKTASVNVSTQNGNNHVETRASGGPVDTGQLFIAREAGPELVGKIGNTTSVMNNQQIVQAVSQGVAQAVASVMSNIKGGETRVIVDGREITSIVEERMLRNQNIYGTV